MTSFIKNIFFGNPKIHVEEHELFWIALADVDEIYENLHNDLDRYLAPKELTFYQSLRSQEYRTDFFSTRVLGKYLCLSQSLLGCVDRFSCLEISSRDQNRRGCTPVLSVNGSPTQHRLSLSHHRGTALAMLSKSENVSPGCDLVKFGTVTKTVSKTFFSSRENSLIHAVSDCETQQQRRDCIWGAKEATYKAFNRGEPFIPISVETTDWQKDMLYCRYKDQSNVVRVIRCAAFDTMFVLATCDQQRVFPCPFMPFERQMD